MKRLALALAASLAVSSAALAGPLSIFPPIGPTGVGISSLAINGSEHLIVTLTDGSTVDAGAISPIPAIVVTPGAVGQVTVPMPLTAKTGWACSVNDLTTTSAQVAFAKEIATTTTQVTIAAFTDIAAPSAFGSSDLVQLNCRPY